MSRSTDSRKLAVWRERLERFSRGDWAVGRFCARERVSVASFYYWRTKVGRAGHPSLAQPPADRPGVFRPVTVVSLDTTRTDSRSVAAKPCVASRVPAGSAVFDAEFRRSELTAEAAPAIRIELPCGTRIEVGTGDPEVVRTIMRAVVRCDDGRHGSVGTC